MAQGLQIFDGNGKTLLDITNRLPKYLGKATIDGTNANSGSIVNSEIGEGDVWWFVVSDSYTDKETTTGNSTTYYYPTITKGSGCLNWSFPSGQKLKCTIIYGIY